MPGARQAHLSSGKESVPTVTDEALIRAFVAATQLVRAGRSASQRQIWI